MENQKVKQFTEDVVKDEIRKGNLIKSKDILAMLPELIDTIHINKDKMSDSIEKCLSFKNPLNRLLKLFGVQLINKEKTINCLMRSETDYSDVSVKIDNSYAEHWITLDKGEFKRVIEKISQKLYDLETQANLSYDNEKKRGDVLFDKCEKLTREYNQLKYDTETSEKLIAEKIQYMLSLGKGEASSENKQLVELLKDMGIEVFWDCKDSPMTDAAMFTEYEVDNEEMTGAEPCFIKDGTVYVKGIRRVKK